MEDNKYNISIQIISMKNYFIENFKFFGVKFDYLKSVNLDLESNAFNIDSNVVNFDSNGFK